MLWHTRFQSSPVPKDGCNRVLPCQSVLACGFNPHPSRRTGATGSETVKVGLEDDVSILTRPEGRVQPIAILPEEWLIQVSILTRPEGRVQPGCYPSCWEGSRCFNPHPSRRTGATRTSKRCSVCRHLFQSSPVPKDGCNNTHQRLRLIQTVSILTRPEGRVQPSLFRQVSAKPARFNPHPSRRTGAT